MSSSSSPEGIPSASEHQQDPANAERRFGVRNPEETRLMNRALYSAEVRAQQLGDEDELTGIRMHRGNFERDLLVQTRSDRAFAEQMITDFTGGEQVADRMLGVTMLLDHHQRLIEDRELVEPASTAEHWSDLYDAESSPEVKEWIANA